MPKETFFNINEQKRKNIENAIIDELERTSVNEVSISNIISKAKIPRGSFYQYFEDKQDALKYIMKKYVSEERKIIQKFLIETNGDIFETSLKIFDYMTEKLERECKINLYKNIFQELKRENIDLFEEETQNSEKLGLDLLIDIKDLNIIKKDDLKYILKIISTITRTANIDVSSGKISKKDAKTQLENQFEILKRGIKKEK